MTLPETDEGWRFAIAMDPAMLLRWLEQIQAACDAPGSVRNTTAATKRRKRGKTLRFSE